MLKIFISNINSPLGQGIYEELRNDDEEPEFFHRIFATLDLTDSTPKPEGTYEVLKVITSQVDRKKEYSDALLRCDVIVIDLHTGNLDEYEEILKKLKETNHASAKTVILISNVFTWGDTPPKTISTEESLSVIEESKIDVSQEVINSESFNKKKHKKIVPFEDSDYYMRKAYPKYEIWKFLENLALSCSKTDNLNCYVLCAGVLYGCGEIALGYHFMSGWLGEIESLPYIAPGDNIIPSIHINDLSKMVKSVVKNQPPNNYLIACDKSSDSQLSIIQSIASIMGDGKISSVPYTEVMLDTWCEHLSFNLIVKCSDVLSESIEWHCEKGIVANIDTLNQEFNLYRGLRSIKVFVTGPPVSGKSSFSKKLAERYNIPHLHISQIIQEILQSSNELGERVRKKLADLRQHMIEEAESKKKKNQEIDYSKFNPRVPEELVAEILKWKLSSNICRNRGYILDGWPRKYDDAKRLYMKDDENLDMDIIPDSVVVIKGTNEFLIARAKAMPEQLVVGTHYNDEGMKRRLQLYREANIPDKQSTHDFFAAHKIEILDIDASIEENAGIETISKFIERNGKPFKFPAYEEANIQETLINFESAKNLKEDDSKKLDNGQNVDYLILMEQLKAKENSLLELRSQPIRNYLMENVVPSITEGLFALCETKPSDPVEFLANFLKSKKNH